METLSTFYITRDDLDQNEARIITEGLIIGRSINCELKLSNQAVSRLQAAIRKTDGKFRILNLQPSNPFLVNGKQIREQEEVALSTGDLLVMGLYLLTIGHRDDALTIHVERLLGYEADDLRRTSPDAATQRLPDLSEILARFGKSAGPIIAPEQDQAEAGQAKTDEHEGAETAPPASEQLTTAPVAPVAPETPAAQKRPPPPRRPKEPALEPTHMLDIWLLRIQEKAKAFQPSALFPRAVMNARGLERHGWKRTSDLASRKWYFSVFACAVAALLLVGLLSLIATRWYASAFSPAPLSEAHARRTLDASRLIARAPNAGSCLTCHTVSGSRAAMETNCASCHDASGQQQGAFVATVIPEHKAAGIGCTACHAEHRGARFDPAMAALDTCTGCHNDANKKLYNGRAVGTPHGGTFGYPVRDDKWTWKGLDEAAWTLKQISFQRAPGDTDDQWRSKQFHALHLYRVKAAPGMPANKQGELSCSSCHRSFDPIDRETPRKTCAACHNGRTDERTGRVLIAADAPNCTSCHVQHIMDRRHWNASLLTARSR